MKVEITPTGEPLTEATLIASLEKIRRICREQKVQLVMRPTLIKHLTDGRVSLTPWK